MKRKNDERVSGWWYVVALVMVAILLVGVSLLVDIIVDALVDPCVAGVLEDADSVMVGFEGNRSMRRDEGALLDALQDMTLHRVASVPDDALRHMDVGLYRGDVELLGTMLFWNGEGMAEWWVVIDDGRRSDCGVYSVPVDDVMRVFDALRSDG